MTPLVYFYCLYVSAKTSVITLALALLLSIMMVLASVSALAAATGHTITLSSSDTHTYKIFQVLTGTLSEEGSTQLGNPEWGADATATAKAGTVAAFIESLTGKTEEEVAALVAGVVDTSAAGQGTVDKDHPKTGLATGYYVLVDVTDLTVDPFKNDTASLHVVKVLNDVNGFTVKYDNTSDDKTILSDTQGTATAAAPHAVWNGDELQFKDGKNNEVSVGDTVNYQIKAHVPDMAENFNYFYFIINDTLSEGLTLDATSIKVYKDSTATEDNLLTVGTDKDYQLKTGTDAAPASFKVALNDAKSLKGKDIYVTYSAEVNDKAKIGEEGNPNDSSVTFSKNPNDDYDGENHKGFPADDEDGALGETPTSETKTYTTGIEIQKVDQDGNVLTGATFTLSGTSVKKVLTVAETFEKFTGADGQTEAEYVYYLLNDGKYTKDAPTATGDYMKPAEAGATAGYVEDANGDTEVQGKKYRAYVPETDAGKKIFVKVTGNGHLYASTTEKYKKVETKTLNEGAATTHSQAMEVNANGLARFDGLSKGTYTITETVTPDGYNTVAPLTLTIDFDLDGTPKWIKTGTGDGWTYDSAEGIFKITIENNKGNTLPETGGIGTTIFYVAGSILVLAAAVLLITKRRMGAND